MAQLSLMLIMCCGAAAAFGAAQPVVSDLRRRFPRARRAGAACLVADASAGGTLGKLLQAIAKHKWAYPFKRPVTDKEAPDYKEIITNVRRRRRPLPASRPLPLPRAS